MRTNMKRKPLLSDDELFCMEQWTALLIGVVCFGTSLWAGVHDYGATPSAIHSGLANEAFVLLSWPLIISAALIGVVLVRFAFCSRNGKKKDQGPADAPARKRGSRASVDANTAKFAAYSNGRQ